MKARTRETAIGRQRHALRTRPRRSGAIDAALAGVLAAPPGAEGVDAGERDLAGNERRSTPRRAQVGGISEQLRQRSLATGSVQPGSDYARRGAPVTGKVQLGVFGAT